MEIEDKLKLDYLLKTFILSPFANHLVALIMSTILVPAAQLAKPNHLPEISPVIIYREYVFASNIINRTFECLSHDQDPKTRLLLKEIVSNLMAITENLL